MVLDWYFLSTSNDMDFWKIKKDEDTVEVIWSHHYFDDYRHLAYQFYECGYQTFVEVIRNGHNNVKADMWFLTGIFLVRQSIELGLKSLLCRSLQKNKDIQNVFEECCHDLSALFKQYCEVEEKDYLTRKEKEWLIEYLDSLEEVDEKSDIFRFPFENEFLSKYRDKFLNNVDIANNLLQAFALVKKCIQDGIISEEDRFDDSFKPQFFIFASHGIENCYLWQRLSDEGFYAKIRGYTEVLDFIYQNQKVSKETKLYPLMFMFRNTIELCLKRLFYSRVDDGVPLKVFYSKRKSHLIKKDLWKNVKPVILKYAHNSTNDIAVVTTAEKMIEEINSIDKNGDNFRYPTSYSLEYRFDNKKVDLTNIYDYNTALINFLDCCYSMLEDIADYQNEMKAEMNMEWY